MFPDVLLEIDAAVERLDLVAREIVKNAELTPRKAADQSGGDLRHKISPWNLANRDKSEPFGARHICDLRRVRQRVREEARDERRPATYGQARRATALPLRSRGRRIGAQTPRSRPYFVVQTPSLACLRHNENRRSDAGIYRGRDRAFGDRGVDPGDRWRR
jgi:hypothetical protein